MPLPIPRVPPLINELSFKFRIILSLCAIEYSWSFGWTQSKWDFSFVMECLNKYGFYTIALAAGVIPELIKDPARFVEVTAGAGWKQQECGLIRNHGHLVHLVDKEE